MVKATSKVQASFMLLLVDFLFLIVLVDFFDSCFNCSVAFQFVCCYSRVDIIRCTTQTLPSMYCLLNSMTALLLFLNVYYYQKRELLETFGYLELQVPAIKHE